MNKQKLLVRPVQENDLRPLCDIASKVGAALPSLPNDEKTIKAHIQQSLDSFAEKNAVEARLYFFVLEDLIEGHIVGTSAIIAEAGFFSPFYSYCVETLVQRHQSNDENIEFDKKQFNKILYLSNSYQESSILATLFVDPSHRALGQGTLLSRIRYLFIAEFSSFFSDNIIAEMRGIFNSDNQFPFWKGLGEHFYNMDILEVEKFLAIKGSQLISDLNPKLPIYCALLPLEAQKVIAEVHVNTKPALHVLEKEGFIYRNHIDILDGGPIVEARKNDIRTVKISQTAILSGYIKVMPFEENYELTDVKKDHYIVCNASLNFRATLALVEWQSENEVYLEETVAALLEIPLGAKIRLVAFH